MKISLLARIIFIKGVIRVFSEARMMKLIILILAIALIVIIFLANKFMKNNASKKSIEKVRKHLGDIDNKNSIISRLNKIDELVEILKRNDVQGIYYGANNLKNIENITWLHKYVEFTGNREENISDIEVEKQRFKNLKVGYEHVKFEKFYAQILNEEMAKSVGSSCFYEILINDLENYNLLIDFCMEYLDDKYNEKIVYLKPELERLHEKVIKEKQVYDMVLENYKEYKDC